MLTVALKTLGLVRNCWFCQSDQRVPWASRASWTCTACAQYNGFTSSGDYNRDIPEMRTEQLCTGVGQKRDNGLCEACNLHQELKVQQLAKFEPSREDRYDQEVEEYEKHLERAYRLCRRCEATVHQKLGEQESWLKLKLLAWKVELNRLTASKSVQIVKRNLRAKQLPFRLAAFLFIAALVVNLHIVTNGISRSTATSLVRELGQLLMLHKADLSALIMVMIIACLAMFQMTRSLAANLTHWLVVWSVGLNVRFGTMFVHECREVLPFFAFLLLPAAFGEIAWECVANERRKVNNIAAVKAKPVEETVATPDLSDHSSFKETRLTHDMLSNTTSTTTHDIISNRISTPSRRAAPGSIRSGLDSNLLSGKELSLAVPSRAPTPQTRVDISRLSINGSSDEENEEEEREVADTFSLSGSLLRQRRPKHNSSRVLPATFTRHSYGGGGGNNSVLSKSGFTFGQQMNTTTTSAAMSPPGSLLKPARFHPSKTSWVAGGYWQNNASAPTRPESPFLPISKRANPLVRDDSRPSSKSSGFISSSERNNVNSRPSSLFGGEDMNRSLLFSTHSQRGGSQFSDDSDEDAMSQYSAAVNVMPKPRAQSSPIVVPVKVETEKSWLDRKVSCSLLHLVIGVSLAVSLAANVVLFLMPGRV